MKIKLKEIILLMVMPVIFTFVVLTNVLKVIEENKNETFINTAKTIVLSAENKYITNKSTGIYNTINCDNLIKLDNNFSYCSIYIDNDDISVTLKGNKKFYGMNICSDTKDKLKISNSCNNKCFNNDIVDVNKPYKIKNYNSCLEYTKKYFMEDLNYSFDKVNSICNDDNIFNANINNLFNIGVTDIELVKNNVIEGNINNVCIPNEIKNNCYSFKIYTENDNKYAEITEYNDVCGNNIVVPKSIMGIPVEKIADYAFHQKKINHITLPESIRYIGTGAFQGHGDGINSDLYGIYLTGTLDLSNLVNLEEIDYFAFADNGISKVILPDSLKVIGSYAFSGNSIEGELDLSKTKLTRIDSYVFSSSKITSIKLPITINTIAFTAFAGNDIYGELDLSTNINLTKIEEDAFANNKITSIKLPSSIKEIKRMSFYNNNITGILDFSSNEKLTIIGENAFENNNIESIILPSSIENISKNAFLKNEISNPNLIEVVNPTNINFDWKEIVINTDMNFSVIDKINT